MNFEFLAHFMDMPLYGCSIKGYQFLISQDSDGFYASWKSVEHIGRMAIPIDGNPFKSLQAAESACRRTYKGLTNRN